jgi:hypothetical protein
MKTNIKNCRPSISTLNAAHMKSALDCTLYVALIMTGNNEIYPIAFEITMSGNENMNNWKWFLKI